MVRYITDGKVRTWNEIVNEFLNKRVILDVVDGTIANIKSAIVYAVCDKADAEGFKALRQLNNDTGKVLSWDWVVDSEPGKWEDISARTNNNKIT